VFRLRGYRGPWLSTLNLRVARPVSGERRREGDSYLSNRTISPSRLTISRFAFAIPLMRLGEITVIHSDSVFH
jgi:hypothetical protein